MRKQISKRGPFSLSLHFGINQPSLNPFLGEERRKSSVGGRNLFPSFSISRWMDGILLRMKRLQCDWRRQWPGVNWRRNVVRTKSEQSRLKRKKDVGDEREKRASNLPNLYFSSAYISIVFVSLSLSICSLTMQFQVSYSQRRITHAKNSFLPLLLFNSVCSEIENPLLSSHPFFHVCVCCPHLFSSSPWCNQVVRANNGTAHTLTIYCAASKTPNKKERKRFLFSLCNQVKWSQESWWRDLMMINKPFKCILKHANGRYRKKRKKERVVRAPPAAAAEPTP